MQKKTFVCFICIRFTMDDDILFVFKQIFGEYQQNSMLILSYVTRFTNRKNQRIIIIKCQLMCIAISFFVCKQLLTFPYDQMNIIINQNNKRKYEKNVNKNVS